MTALTAKRRNKFRLAMVWLAASVALAAQQPCTPGGGMACTPNLNLWLPPANYQAWDVPLNSNFTTIDQMSVKWGSGGTPPGTTAGVPNWTGTAWGTTYTASNPIPSSIAPGGGGGGGGFPGCTSDNNSGLTCPNGNIQAHLMYTLDLHSDNSLFFGEAATGGKGSAINGPWGTSATAPGWQILGDDAYQNGGWIFGVASGATAGWRFFAGVPPPALPSAPGSGSEIARLDPSGNLYVKGAITSPQVSTSGSVFITDNGGGIDGPHSAQYQLLVDNAYDTGGGWAFAVGSASTQGFKFYNGQPGPGGNQLMQLDPSGNLTVKGTITGNNVYSCGTASACAPVVQTAPKIVYGKVTLSGGNATVTGMPGYTSTTSYICTCSDTTGGANACNAVAASATSINLSGSGGDTVVYQCIGN
jgi:hypothetical protein